MSNINIINTFTNRILWGDCIQVMQRLPSQSIELVVPTANQPIVICRFLNLIFSVMFAILKQEEIMKGSQAQKIIEGSHGRG